MMEAIFETPITALTVHPVEPGRICSGHLDGGINCSTIQASEPCATPSKEEGIFKLDEKWKTKLKRSIRGVTFSHDGTAIFAVSSNRALCMFDTETGKKLRCIRKSHKSRPNSLTLLPLSINTQQIATGAENGEVKMWDFRQTKPEICSFNDQEDIINSFYTWKNNLLAASGDGTLAAYDLNKRKLRVQSEAMHSELLSLTVTDKFTYVGAADGHIEVFNNGEYGNIFERIETPLVMGVEQLLKLRNDLLLAASSTHEEMRFVHVNPNKILGGIPQPDGVDLMMKTADSSLLLVTSADGSKIRAFGLPRIVRDVPILRAQDMHKFKQREKEERKRKRLDEDDFFKDMLSDDDDDEGDNDEDDSSEED